MDLMSNTLLSVVMTGLLVLALLYYTFGIGSGMQWAGLRQIGDSSLRPGSVNWLAAIAFAAAFVICFVLA